jgi:lipid-A-disaccharide synthase
MPASNVLIIAGEISGDLYAAELAKELKQFPINIIGLGGDKLEAESHQSILNIAHENIIGIEALFQFKLKNKLKKALSELLKKQTVSYAILIDFQHHNQLIASYLQKHNIPIITFITPNFWIWNDIKKATQIVSYSSEIVTIFKKEYTFYKTLTDNVHFFGHPLPFLTPPSIKDLQKYPCLSQNKTIIALFPGSRKQELDIYLSPLCKTVETLLSSKENNSFEFHLALSSNTFLPQIEAALHAYNLDSHIKIWADNHTKLFAQANAMICASGTTTLQGILYEIPMIILCALSPVSYWVATTILRLNLPYKALPNIIAGAHITPELVQKEITSKNIIDSLQSILLIDKKNITSIYSPIKKELIYKNPFEQLAFLINKKVNI